MALASSARRPRSPGSSGPTRQASNPSGLSAGCRRPRATRPTPAVITAAQTRAVLVVTRESSRSSRSGRAVPIGTRAAGTRRRRTDLPAGRAISMVTWSPSAASSPERTSPSSPLLARKAAKHPARGGSPTTKVRSKLVRELAEQARSSTSVPFASSTGGDGSLPRCARGANCVEQSPSRSVSGPTW